MITKKKKKEEEGTLYFAEPEVHAIGSLFFLLTATMSAEGDSLWKRAPNEGVCNDEHSEALI